MATCRPCRHSAYPHVFDVVTLMSMFIPWQLPEAVAMHASPQKARSHCKAPGAPADLPGCGVDVYIATPQKSQQQPSVLPFDTGQRSQQQPAVLTPNTSTTHAEANARRAVPPSIPAPDATVFFSVRSSAAGHADPGRFGGSVESWWPLVPQDFRRVYTTGPKDVELDNKAGPPGTVVRPSNFVPPAIVPSHRPRALAAQTCP